MTKIIYDKWENGSLVKHEVTEDKNGHPTWSIKESWTGLNPKFVSYLASRHTSYTTHYDEKNDTDILISNFDWENFYKSVEQILKEKNHG